MAKCQTEDRLMRLRVMGDWAALRRRTRRGLSWQRMRRLVFCQALYSFVETCISWSVWAAQAYAVPALAILATRVAGRHRGAHAHDDDVH